MNRRDPTKEDLAAFVELQADIAKIARSTRESGDIAAAELAALDDAFHRFLPSDQVCDPGVSGAVLDLSAGVDTSAFGSLRQTKGARPLARRAARIATGADISLLAGQLDRVARTTARAIDLLDHRLRHIEAWTVGFGGLAAVPRADTGTGGIRPRLTDDGPWVDAVVSALGSKDGRVLVAHAGAGATLRALVAAGVDAYGAEPEEKLFDDLVGDGFEVRLERAHDHLARVPDAALAGLVLAGCVERLTRPGLLALAELCATKVGQHGTVVVVGTDPLVWYATSPVEVDLGDVRPFHAETWAYLLDLAGFEDVSVETEESSQDAVSAGGAAHSGAPQHSELRSPSAWYAVLGTKA